MLTRRPQLSEAPPSTCSTRLRHAHLPADAHGHILLETIVSATLVSLISLGLWQLVAAARRITSLSSETIQARCDIPRCNTSSDLIHCRCNDTTFVIIR